MEPLQADDPRTVGGFELMNRIGAGGMGMVYLGRRAGDPRLAAIKLIRAELLADDDLRGRFDREVAAARKVDSGSIARVLDAGYDADRAFLAVEYVQGPTLREAVRRDGPLDARALVRLAEGLADALIAIHAAGIVHRDLTPQNVLLTHSGPRIIDFGIVRIDDVTTRTATGVVVGTPGYVAPERLVAGESLPAADVFSVGAMLLYAATGRPPFGSGSAMEVHYRAANVPADLTGAPAALAPVIAACLRREPAERPTAAQLQHLVQQIHASELNEMSVSGPPPPIDPAVTAITSLPTVGSGSSPAGAVVAGSDTAIDSRSAGRPYSGQAVAGSGPSSRRRGRWLALAAVLVLVIAGGVFAIVQFGGGAGTGGASASASTGGSPNTGAAGTYAINKTLYSGSGLEVTLTNVTVNADGGLRASVRYRDVSIPLLSLACSTVTDPTIDKITTADGTVHAATNSYCSDHPDAILVLTLGQTSASYAVFAPGIDTSKPVTFTWQDDDQMSGSVAGIRLGSG